MDCYPASLLTPIRAAIFTWNRWPSSRGISGRLSVESVAVFPWNQWPSSRGISGRLPVESVAGMLWNTQPYDGRASMCVRIRLLAIKNDPVTL